ncbi:MAG: BREX-1 system adenine-specific DNA-methyltransferase PglX [Bacteroidales bacterium]|nr:BREX-1 system adenine-specific DNA-methyltransferase PglX [Bacteroidales bacterium]
MPATQLYTEPYMVKFLVQNSLGATWMGMYPDSDLSEEWEYYVKDADRAPVRRKNVENITFLDPACGSGHFLIEAFDLFYRMYEAEGKYTDPETICKKILARNLYGIDIDERAVQIARGALWMKAAERVFDFSGTPKNIIATNIRLPKGKDHLKVFLQKHPEDAPLQPALETIFEGLAHANELGSLLQIEEPVERELRWLRDRFGGQTTLSTGDFTAPTTDEEWEAWKDGVIERLADHFTAEAEAADLVNAFFSQNAGKGVRLFELLSKRYDVVAANPPYMGLKFIGITVQEYLNENYKISKNDICTSFIERGIKLTKKYGYLSFLTSHSWMFLGNYEELRKMLLCDGSFTTVCHLGPKTFPDLSNSNAFGFTMFSYRINGNSEDLAIIFRLVHNDYQNKNSELLNLLLDEKSKNGKGKKFALKNETFNKIPANIIFYWAPTKILDMFSSNDSKMNQFCDARQGLITGDNNRFMRFFWEIPNSNFNNRWYLYSKGGPFRRWFGNEYYVVDWDFDGFRIKNNFKSDGRLKGRPQNIPYFFKEGCTWTTQTSYGLSMRYHKPGCIFDAGGSCFFPKREDELNFLLSLSNSILFEFIFLGMQPTVNFGEGYLEKIPVKCDNKIQIKLSLIGDNAKNLKRAETSLGYLIESEYDCSYFLNDRLCSLKECIYNHLLQLYKLQSQIAYCETIINNLVFKSYSLNEAEINTILEERGYPHFYYPLVTNFDDIICPFDDSEEIINNEENITYKHSKGVNEFKSELKHIFSNVSCIQSESDEDITSEFPKETIIENIASIIKIHPISVYWLLKGGIEQEGWRCIPEERRITTDRFTVMILRMLGHRWPKQIEAGEPVPDWADADGIIPLTSDTGEATLLERVRVRIAVEFPGGSVAAIEREFEEVMGTSLEDWLNTGFFKHHTKQFKKRPIAWQVQSGKFTKKRRPAFACLVYYHKLDGDTLHKIRNHYVGPLRQRYETEIRGIESIRAASRTEVQEQRFRELEGLIAELKAFGETLTDVAENGFSSKTLEKIAKSEPLDSWCSIDGKRPAPADREAFLRQEKSYIPDINDGVRVNVVPLQKAGLLAADVIAKKDLEKAISDRAEWRADERRWCREGKLPKCGWWE